jgi:ribokinase
MRDASDVLVIGDAVLDVAVAPEDEPRPGADVPAAVGAAPGGQGANIAVRLARRGIPVRLACAIGEDVAGRIVRHALSAEGVLLEAAGTGGSGVVVILVAADGERTMFSRRIPLLPLRFDTTAAWTIVSGYVLLEDGELQLNDRGGRIAVVGCSLPDAHAIDWWRRTASLRPDLVVMNADEARAVGADAATLALEAGAIVVITGPDGVDAAHPNLELAVRRVRIDRVPAADTTGAGDAFAAALIADLRDSPWPPPPAALDSALAAAARFAAEVTRVAGAQSRVPGEPNA